MQRSNRLVRLFRALSEQSKMELAVELGVHSTTVTAWEEGKYEPSPERLERIAGLAGLTVAGGIELLQFVEDLRKPRQRPGQGAEDLFAQAGELFSNRARIAYQRMLRARLMAGVSETEVNETRPEGPADPAQG